MKIPILVPRAGFLSGLFLSAREAVASPLSLSVSFAQVPTALRDGFQAGLGVMFLGGFLWGVVTIWGGAHKLKNGDADGKMGIVAGIIIAAAAAIMAALFAIFGMAGGALTPTF